MTANEAIEIIKYASAFNNDNSPLTKALEVANQALEEIQQYREIGTVEKIKEELDRLRNDNECQGLYFTLEERKALAKQSRELSEYKAIVTVEELQALKEKFENAKDDIRKLLSSEYGSSCQFCVHDENEDAMCCNIGGSGSWCCENARWKEH